MIKYLHKVRNLSPCFLSYEVEHVPHKQNFKKDLLSKIATSKVTGFNRTIIPETFASPYIEGDEAYFLEFVPESNWMSSILHYLQSGELPSDEGEARKLRRKAAKYTLISGKL